MKAVSQLKDKVSLKRLVAISVWLGALTIFMRLWQLDQIPPGVHVIEAENGLAALAGKFVPSLKETQHALSLGLIAISQKFTTGRVLGLRLGPALAGMVSVVFFYRWLLKVYGRRVAQVGALFLAVLPWSLYLTRFGSGYALAILIMSISLFLLGTSWQRRGSRRAILTIVALAAGLYAHPSYNWFLLGVILAGLVNIKGVVKFRKNIPTRLTIGSLVFLLAAAAASPAIISYILKIPGNIGVLTNRVIALGQLFNLRAPSDPGFNLAVLPLMSVFVGLMLVLGLLVVVTTLKRTANRTVLMLFLGGLLGFVLIPASAPLADKTLALLLPSVTLAALGTDYMLSQWLKTFPQNSAARNLGTAALLVLLFFSVRHSYSQYFLAWRASTQTKQAYHVNAIEAVKFVDSQGFDGARFLVGSQADLTVAEYLAKEPKAVLSLPDLAKIEKKDGPKQFILLPSTKDQAIKSLAKKFPGGKLEPKLSDSNLELFLIYTAK